MAHIPARIRGILRRVPAVRAPLSARERVTEGALGLALLAVVAGMLLTTPTPLPSLELVAVLIGTYAVCSCVRFWNGSEYTMPVQLAFMAMLVLLPPALIPPAAAAGLALARVPMWVTGRMRTDRLLHVLPDCWYTVGPALVVSLLGPLGLGDGPLPLLAELAAVLIAQFFFDTVIGELRDRLGLGEWTPLDRGLIVDVVRVDAALAPVGLLAGVAARDEPLAALAILPLVGLLVLFARERAERLEQAAELATAYRGTALLMSEVLEADDAYTGGEHTHGVVALAIRVGEALSLDPTTRRDLEFGALLHDIGKIHVPDAIINKPGKLTPEEWEIIKRHPEDGQRMLERVGGVLSAVGVVVRGHHESWNGRGYPDGLVGEDIPLASRIISVCDAFSAMTTDRSYRKGMPVAEALAELARCAGTQFDPQVVAVLLELMAPTAVPAGGGRLALVA